VRNKTFDVIRGIAIVLMIFANLAPLYPDQFPFVMRVLFSIPAPMFIMISGLMLALGTDKHPFSYFFKRALFIFALAALIDIGIQQIMPFQGFDILYLIGLSMPIVILALRLNSYVLFLVIIGIFFAGEFARWNFGYVPLPVEAFSFHRLASYPNVKQWLIGGDFPMLPWTGVMLFGGLIGKLYVASKDTNYFQSKFFICLVISMIFLGLFLLISGPRSEFLVVHGYAELFYPATAGVVICLTSLTMILLTLSYLQGIKLLGELGRSSLAIYTFHLFLIEVAAVMLGSIISIPVYFMFFFVLFTLVLCFSHLLLKFKNKHPKLPTLVAWFVGT